MEVIYVVVKVEKIAGDSCVEDSDCNPSLTFGYCRGGFCCSKEILILFTGDVINVDQKMECKKCDDKYCLTALGKCGLKIGRSLIKTYYPSSATKQDNKDDTAGSKISIKIFFYRFKTPVTSDKTSGTSNKISVTGDFCFLITKKKICN